MIIQGSNNPLTIEFSEDVSALPELVVTVWSDLPTVVLMHYKPTT